MVKVIIACRFVPFDQWAVCHLDSSWKVKDVKLFLVAKCVNHPVLNALVAEQNLAKTSSQQRPTSPITFATDSRRRPRSPSGEDEGHDSETFSDNDGSADDRDIFDVVEDSVEPNPPDSPVVQTPPSSHFNSPPSRDPSSQPSSLSKRYTQPKHHEPSATAVAAVLSTVAVSPQQKQMEHGIPSSYDPAHLFLIRFATGQLLEDDRSLDSYDIKAHELIEIHRAGVLLRLPRTNIHEYIQPYFEGWVKALRVIYKPTRPTASDLHSTKSVKTQATDPPTTRSSLEWRKRWVVIHDGVFSISKDRAQLPAQVHRLAALKSLRGAEHLRRSTTITLSDKQRIVCAKFTIKKKSKSHLTELGASMADITRPKLDTAPSSSSLKSAADLSHSLYKHFGGEPSKSKPKLKLNIKSNISIASINRTNAQSRPTNVGPDDPPRIFSKSRPIESKARDKSPKSTETPRIRVGKMQTVTPAAEPHPKSEDEKAQGGGEPAIDDNTSSSPASPVFAHSELEESDDVEVRSDDPHRPGYSFGYSHNRLKTGTRPMSESSDEEDDITPRQPHLRKSATSDHIRGRRGDSRGNGKDEEGEWVVLDVGDDHAFTSILRTLHRGFPPPILSAFVKALPSFTGTGVTPAATPPPSPPAESMKPRLNRFPQSLADAIAPSQTSRSHPEVLQRESSTFGALPYPEWRLEVARKAQKAGLGDVGKPMETFIFGRLLGPASVRSPISALHNPDSIQTHVRADSGESEDSFKSFDDENEGLIEGESDSDEASEKEWLGWMADLHRQTTLATEERNNDEEALRPSLDRGESLTDDEEDYPRDADEDRRRIQLERRALEPSGKVMSTGANDEPVASLSSTPSIPLPRMPSPNHSFAMASSMGFYPMEVSSERLVNDVGSEHHGSSDAGDTVDSMSLRQSIGRSSSILGRGPGLLRKKEPRKEKGKKGLEHHSKSPRPRHSLSSLYTPAHSIPTPLNRSISPPGPTVRRVKSGSSLTAETVESENAGHVEKKKRGIVREVSDKLTRGWNPITTDTHYGKL